MFSFYQFSPRQIIVPNRDSAYFIRNSEAIQLCREDRHNPEWYIQQKISENAEGYFDFSKSMIDIGACYGIYSFVLPFKYSFLFEPNKESFAYCNANMLLHNKIYQAEIFNMAVSDKTGYLKFDGFTGGDLANESGNVWMNTNKCVEVPCIKLDDMQDKLINIGFIKIDIEGMEPYAIMGAKQVIKNNNYPPILFESWTPDMGGESSEHYEVRITLLNKVFSELGYTVLLGWGDEINHLAIHK